MRAALLLWLSGWLAPALGQMALGAIPDYVTVVGCAGGLGGSLLAILAGAAVYKETPSQSPAPVTQWRRDRVTFSPSQIRRSAPAGRGTPGIAARNNRSSAGRAIRAAARPAPWSCPESKPHAPAPSRRRRVRARRGSAAARPCAGASVIGSRARPPSTYSRVGSTACGPRSAFSQSS